MVFNFFYHCNDLWGGCSDVTSIQNSIDSSKPLSNDDLDLFSPLGSSSIVDIPDANHLSNKKESNELSYEQETSKCKQENGVDAENLECNLPQPIAGRRKVKEMLNERKDKKLIGKFCQEA